MSNEYENVKEYIDEELNIYHLEEVIFDGKEWKIAPEKCDISINEQSTKDEM